MRTLRTGTLAALTLVAGLIAQSCNKSEQVPPNAAIPDSNAGTDKIAGDTFIRTGWTGTFTGDIKYLIYDHLCQLVGVVYTKMGMPPVRYTSCTATNFSVRDYLGNTVTLQLRERHVITPWRAGGAMETMVAVFHDQDPSLGWLLFDPCATPTASTPLWRFTPGVGPTGSWACNLAPVTANYESYFNMGLPTCP